MAKNTNKTAAAKSTAKSTAKSSKPYYEARREAVEKFKAEYGSLLFHNCETTKDAKNGDNSLPAGSMVEVQWIGPSKFALSVPTARVLHKGNAFFLHPDNLNKGKKMSDARIAILKSEQEEASSATILVVGEATKVVDGKDGKDGLIIIRSSGWPKNIAFTKTMVVKREGTFPFELASGTVDRDIFEVPQWKVKKEVGQDGLDALLAKQDDIKAHLLDETQS